VTDIVSISFEEDSVLWSEFSKNDKAINIQRVAFETLPIFINHQTIQKKISVTQLSNLIKNLAQAQKWQNKKINLTFPGRFAIIKKIMIDESISAEMQHDFVLYEFEKSWEESTQNYSIFLPSFEGFSDTSRYLVAVAVRKNLLEFFESIFEKAQLELETITPSCFTIEELFRLIHPTSSGQSLLLGWRRRGIEAIITDQHNFRDYYFHPYNSKLDLIENVTEFDLANGFSNLFFEIQQPRALDQPLYDIQTIFNYGYFFRSEWLDFMRSRIDIPINLFNFEVATDYQMNFNHSQIPAEEIYKYVEPISCFSLIE